MTNDTLKSFILAFNDGSLPSLSALRRLTDNVVFGRVWPERLNGRVADASYKLYFVLLGARCIGVVLEMDDTDLHWYVLEEHRKHGHLHAALRACILPHIFSDGRSSQRVTVDSQANAGYVVRQGFVPNGDREFIMHREQLAVPIASIGENSPLSPDDIRLLNERLREARMLVQSVHETLVCRCGNDAICLEELASQIQSRSIDLHDLDENGVIPGQSSALQSTP
jgi:hypothetical protein